MRRGLVTFVGRTTRRRISRIRASSSAFVLPSFKNLPSEALSGNGILHVLISLHMPCLDSIFIHSSILVMQIALKIERNRAQ